MEKINRKGVSNAILHVLTEIAVIALVIAVFLFMAGKIWGSVFGNADKNTLSFFNALADNVQLMVDKPTDFEHQSMISYIHSGYYVRSFIIAPGQGHPPEECRINGEYKSCMCLYTDWKKLQSEDKPSVCKTFEPNVAIYGYYTNKPAEVLEPVPVAATLGPADSFFSGYPENLRPGSSSFKFYHNFVLFNSGNLAQDLYIEKFVSSGTIYVLITPYLSDDQVRERISSLSLCPESSSAQCIGQPMDRNVGDSGFCYFDENQQKCTFVAVSACAENKLLVKPCYCGSTYVDTTDLTRWKAAYCYKHNDGRLTAYQFDCSAVKECKDYCTTLTADSDDCGGDEIDYCTTNICSKEGLACNTKPLGINSQQTCDNEI